MKKILIALLGITMAFALAACGNTQQQQQPETPSAEMSTEVVGGWEIPEGDMVFSENEHPNAVAAFEKATAELVGAEHEALAVLGKQVVAGTNFAYLCRSKVVAPESKYTYQIMYVYQDLQGNAEVVGFKELLPATKDGQVGAWEYNQGEPSLEQNPDVQAAFEKATGEMLGADYEPIALVAKQVVSGTNYQILCRETTVTNPPVNKIAMVTVYADLQGNAEVTDIQDIELDLSNVD